MRVDLGCGNSKEEGCIGIDIIKTPAVDMVADIEKRIPLKTSSVDEMYCNHVLEHVELMPAIEEIFRVMRNGGKVHVLVPYYSSKDFFTDPTHKTSFTEHTFDKYFSMSGKLNFYTSARFKVETIRFNYSTFGRLVPFKKFFRHILLNMVDSIYFRLEVKK